MADQDPSELHLPAEPPPDKDPSVEETDPDGNVTLLIEGQSRARFLVSSKILSMASPVFARLFGQRFYEGTQMANLSCPTIPLHEDDPVAMRIIIRILHYQEPEQGVSVDAETLAKISIHCDKYDCVKALNPWVFKWFSELQHITTVEEHGYLLLAAHLFRSAEQFSTVSIKAQTQLPCMFIARWEKVHMMDLLPDGVQNYLMIDS
ncbi:predicted protein [Aspergillus terreus NIH2624]|uniref:BTB domain-containing protein n=1 Tax=Aspergillus terreus (strain NIH 2624 / FGSC A1156) TaxID=341663 RepID=Q0CLC9_ASPTN|nr:uncharacterized protein ATEG_05505 [Aspergillus terreus NIH2624]EAU34574.1 predicted protein [Aspergillus terreus NIH2624]